MFRVEAMRARLAENSPTLTGSAFDFICDEEVCYFEVRVYDGDEKLEVRQKQDDPGRMYCMRGCGIVHARLHAVFMASITILREASCTGELKGRYVIPQGIETGAWSPTSKGERIRVPVQNRIG